MRTMASEYSVSDLASLYPMSFAAVQKHVAVLAKARLVTKHKRGREVLVRGNLEAIGEAHQELDRFEAMWRERMERFDRVLQEETERR